MRVAGVVMSSGCVGCLKPEGCTQHRGAVVAAAGCGSGNVVAVVDVIVIVVVLLHVACGCDCVKTRHVCGAGF